MITPRLHILGNGARVLFDPMPELETLALSVVVDGGARWEPEDRSGWSHMLEHMVFKGAGDRSAREIVETVEAAGAQINAATGYERTSFQIRALKGGLDLGMSVLSDLLFRPLLDPAELEREKEVIGQEIAEAFDTPDDHVFDLLQARAFAGQPLGRPILGSNDSLAPARRDTLDAWRRRLYAPEHMVISAAGAIDEAELLTLAERWFGSEAASGMAREVEPALFVGGTEGLARRIEQANLVWSLPAPGAKHPDYYAIRLFAEILGGGMASRLFQEAREQRGLAYAIDAWSDAYEDVGLLSVFAGAAATKAEQLSKLVATEVRKLAERPTDAELARAKAQVKASLFMAQESPLTRAEISANRLFLFDRVLPAAEVREAIDGVGVDDLRRVGEGLFAGRTCAAAALGPKSALKAPEAFAKALFAES
ncbi:MAG TPA: pitrilysin family protein [Caulobacteraceae bacterium]|nr:pitrilysin family protein [Caulobacteraceae bacterium]